MPSRPVWPDGLLGEHAYIKARIGWRGLSSSEYTHDGPYLIAGNHITNGSVNWSACDHISKRRYQESWEIALRPGDVILTKDGTIGRVAILDTLPGQATINGTMMLVRPHAPLTSRFVYHYLTGSTFQKLVLDKVSGSSIPHIFQRDMQQLPIPIPPEAEQRRIADILDTVDSAILQTEALIAKLKQVRIGLLHDLLTCGLDERGELRDPATHPERFQDSSIGRLPASWGVGRLGHMLTAIDAGKSPDCPDTPASSGAWGVLKVSAIGAEGFKPGENKALVDPRYIDARCEIHDGDLLMSRANGNPRYVGLACIATSPPPHLLLCDKTLRLIADTTKATPRYLVHVMQMPSTRAQIESNSNSSSGMRNITQSAIRGLTVPLPNKQEQQRICDIIDAHDARIRAEESYLAKLRLLKQGLMDDLLTGRVRVPVAQEAAI